MPDYTSSANNIEGALYFGRVQDEQPTKYMHEGVLVEAPGSWFYENILKKQDEHKLLGTWGVQQFFS
jgi:hypothetical protein